MTKHDILFGVQPPEPPEPPIPPKEEDE